MRTKHFLPLLVLLLTTLSTHAYDFQSGNLCYNITSDTTVEVTDQVGWGTANYQGLTTATIPETVTNDGTTYSVTSIGEEAFRYCSSLTSITIPNSVTSIEGRAFNSCSALTSITIPNSVTSIGKSAFENCSALTSIVVESGNTVYDSRDNCNAIIETETNTLIAGCQSTSIPYSVTSIGHWAFYGCSSMTSVSIPNSVTSIGDNAFAGCSSLTSIVVESGNTMYDSRDNCNAIIETATNTLISGCQSTTIPNSVTSIGDYAFCQCSSLTSITIPNSVTSIGQFTFNGCTSLTSITIPNSVTSIGEWAFSYCSSLTSIIIPNSVTSIGYEAFYDCSSLTSVVWNAKNCADWSCCYPSSLFYDICSNITSFTFGEEVETIPSGLCEGMSSLTSITIPNSVTSIGEAAFSNVPNIVYYGTATGSPWGAKSVNGYVDGYFVYADEAKTTLLACSAAASGEIAIPESVTVIGDNAFRNCSSITSITIPNSVTSIGDYTFYDCSSLTSLTIPNSVTSIGESAFYDCSSLTSLTIPNSVTSIGRIAFLGCYSLTKTNYIGDIADWCAIQFADYESNPICYSHNLYINDVEVKDLIIPNSVTSIGSSAFYGCSSLTSITIPNSVTSIGRYAFYGCSSLTSITIGNSVMSIGHWAFTWCSALTTVTSMSCTPPDCGSNVFSYTPSEKTLVVPNSSVEAYKSSSPWNTFTTFESIVIVYPTLRVQSANALMGTAHIDQERDDCDGIAIISAVGNLGYAFTQWTDGNTDNPRTVLITQDTLFTAEFGLAYSGKCGDDLYWAYSNKEVKITGTGAMYNYTDSTMPWTLLRDSIMTVRVGNNATSIGEYAFANTPKLAKLYLGNKVENIGANAFLGCNRLYHIYCNPTYPPFAVENSFANYNVYLHIPCEIKEDYTLDLVWGLFKYVECLASENVVLPEDEIRITPSYTDATISFKVIGLNENTRYVYTITIRNEANSTLGTYTGDFTTLSSTPMGVGESPSSTLPIDKDVIEKLLRDGQVVIIRNGETYDMMGQRL